MCQSEWLKQISHLNKKKSIIKCCINHISPRYNTQNSNKCFDSGDKRHLSYSQRELRTLCTSRQTTQHSGSDWLSLYLGGFNSRVSACRFCVLPIFPYLSGHFYQRWLTLRLHESHIIWLSCNLKLYAISYYIVVYD